LKYEIKIILLYLCCFFINEITAQSSIVKIEASNRIYKKIDSTVLKLYKDQGHAFFAKKPIKYFIETTAKIDDFLVYLGYLNGKSTIKNQYK
jgi:hypothetical protein